MKFHSDRGTKVYCADKAEKDLIFQASQRSDMSCDFRSLVQGDADDLVVTAFFEQEDLLEMLELFDHGAHAVCCETTLSSLVRLALDGQRSLIGIDHYGVRSLRAVLERSIALCDAAMKEPPLKAVA